MIGETILSKGEQEHLYYNMDSMKPGSSMHDIILRNIFQDLATNKEFTKYVKPRLIGDRNKYRSLDNYRAIIDDRTKQDIIYAYFDYPSIESFLYIGTFKNYAIQSLTHAAINESAGAFRITPLNSNPVTIKINTSMSVSKEDSNRNTLEKTTLRYLDYPISDPMQIFDVVDLEFMYPHPFLKLIK